MNALQRHEQILQRLADSKFLSLQELMELTGASPATARRDMDELAAQGLVRRAHGGIGLVDSGWGTMTPFAFRQRENSGAKLRLAQRAAELLKPGDVLMIDGGTTTFHLGASLPNIPLRVITNSLNLAIFLEGRTRTQTGLEVFLTGGYLYPNSGLLVGPGAQNSIAQYHAQWAFLSVGGVTEEGLFNTNELVVETERRMIANADHVVLLADHSKINQRAMCHVCNLDQIDYLITDVTPETETSLKKFSEAGVQVIPVDSAGTAGESGT